jgi:hypothetical protein
LLASVAALAFVGWLLAMLYVLPTYFRRLRELVDLLSNRHPDTFERLGRPSLDLLKTQIGSTANLVFFVLRKDYLELDDPDVARSGHAARWRLLLSLAGVPLPLLMGIGSRSM